MRTLDKLPEKCECGGTEFTWDVVKTMVLERSEGDHIWNSKEEVKDVRCSDCGEVLLDTVDMEDIELRVALIDA